MNDKTKLILCVLLCLTSLLLIPTQTNAQETTTITKEVTDTPIFNYVTGTNQTTISTIPLNNRSLDVTSKIIDYEDFRSYTDEKNVSIRQDSVGLLPIYVKTWQNESYSNITELQEELVIINHQNQNGNYTYIWTKVYNMTNWNNESYNLWEYLQPKQSYMVMWEMNMTIPWKQDFYLNLQYALDYANWTDIESPSYVKIGNVSIYNYNTLQWDLLKDNITYQEGINDNTFSIPYNSYRKADSENITVRIYGGTGENDTSVFSGVWIGFAGAFINETYRCQNYTGYYQSTSVELEEEVFYEWENFQIDIANVSYMEDIDQQQTLWDTVGTFGQPLPLALKGGQTFTPLENNYIAIRVPLSKVGNPIDAIQMDIYELSGGKPFGLSLATSQQIPASSMSPLFGIYEFRFNVHLNISKQYCFIVSRTGAPDPINYYQGYAQSGNPYPGGCAILFGGAGGGDWYSSEDLDTYFITYYYVDSYVSFEWRNCTNGISWSSWNTIYHQSGTFAQHQFNVNIQQNVSRYYQFRLNLSSNHPDYLPICYDVKLFYDSYIWFWCIEEYDTIIFNETEIITQNFIYEINITNTFTSNITLSESAFKIYNIIDKKWDPLSQNTTLNINKTILTNYFNGSIYLFYYCKSYLIFELNKTFDILYIYDYYRYINTTKIVFNIEDPLNIKMNSTLYLLDTSQLAKSSIHIFNFSDETYTLISYDLNQTNYTIDNMLYNGSIIFVINIILAELTNTTFNIQIAMIYIPSPGFNWMPVIFFFSVVGVIALVAYIIDVRHKRVKFSW